MVHSGRQWHGKKLEKVDMTENLMAVAGPKVAVVSDKRGSEGLKGSGNPGIDSSHPGTPQPA